MLNNAKIDEIIAVFSGENRVGRIDNSAKRREYDGFVYYLSGEVEYIFSDHRFVARAGSLAYLPRGSSYVMHIRESFSYVCVNLLLEESDGGVLSALCCQRGIPPTVHSDILRLGMLLDSAAPGSYAESFSVLYRVLSAMIRASGGEYRHSDRRAEAAIAYIREHYGNCELTVGEVAAHAQVCEAQLRRIFKPLIGTSPVRYIIAVRIGAAKNLLTDTNLSVAEIAHRTGFADEYYFIRQFTREVGITPGRYRRTNGQNI